MLDSGQTRFSDWFPRENPPQSEEPLTWIRDAEIEVLDPRHGSRFVKFRFAGWEPEKDEEDGP